MDPAVTRRTPLSLRAAPVLVGAALALAVIGSAVVYKIAGWMKALATAGSTGTMAPKARWVALDGLPEWVKPLFSPLVTEDEYSALLERAPLDIRVNRLVTDRETLAKQLPEATSLPESRDGLRLPTGFSIESSELYTSGAIEVQDLGSQFIAEACKAAPEMIVLDLCAGAGCRAVPDQPARARGAGLARTVGAAA